MCYMLYLGADHELPMIAPPDWKSIDYFRDDWPSKAPRLVVSQLNKHQRDALNHFPGLRVVYAGSYEGCGCGFNESIAGEFNTDPIEVAVAKESRLALSRYVEINEVSMLFGCWAGDEGQQITQELDISVSLLADPTFILPERARMVVSFNL